MDEVLSAPTETSSLLSASYSRLKHSKAKKWSLKCSSCAPKRVCIPSKAVMHIFIWSFVFGAIYEGLTTATTRLAVGGSSFYPVITIYLLLAVITMFYPLGGFLADVYCGRYRTVVTSLWFLWLCFFMGSIAAVIYLAKSSSISHPFWDFCLNLVFSIPIFVLLVLGFAGYKSNIVQLGFDQLLDEPSQYLGMFVHWLVWSETLGSTVIYLMSVVTTCGGVSHHLHKLIRHYKILFGSSVPLIILFLLLVFNLFTHHHFYTELAQYNPYKMIINVLNFARKYNQPIHLPSALTAFAYRRKPSRLDFAKEVFGGPFKSSDVNDVKTFGRVLLVLLALGPVFILQVPSSYIVFPTFALYSGVDNTYENTTCDWRWVLLESGSLSYLVTVLALPAIVWLVYSVLRNRVPRILVRLCFAGLLFLLAVVSMLVVDLSGHIILNSERERKTTCMFLQPILLQQKIGHFHPLFLNWWVLLLPNLLMGLAPALIMATTLEFISAQGPHSMKGVLVGLFYSIKGFYQLIGAGLVFPFSLKLWSQVSSVISCEFGYFLVTILIALIGLVCFTFAACKYKYRVRDEEGFSQTDLEEVFDQRLRQEQEYRQSEREWLARRGLLIQDDD